MLGTVTKEMTNGPSKTIYIYMLRLKGSRGLSLKVYIWLLSARHGPSVLANGRPTFGNCHAKARDNEAAASLLFL
jgi:hypothetical protein